MKTSFYRECELSVENQMAWRSELPMMNIINTTLKNKIMTLKNLIEMRQMTLNDPKFDIKKSLDTLTVEDKHLAKLSSKLDNPDTAPKTYWSIINRFLNNKKIPIIPPVFFNVN